MKTCTASGAHPRVNPFSSTLLLLSTILAAELAMLNIIFWARAQGTIEGLAIATMWPWVVAFGAPLLWSSSRHWFAGITGRFPAMHPRAVAGVGMALTAAVLLGRLALFA